MNNSKLSDRDIQDIIERYELGPDTTCTTGREKKGLVTKECSSCYVFKQGYKLRYHGDKCCYFMARDLLIFIRLENILNGI